MKVTFTKKNNKTQLVCQRQDGTVAMAMLGPQVPYHDLAHLVVEQHMGLQKGFFGYVEDGWSIEELSKKEVIKTLDQEAWQAEVLTRALGSLATGACTIDQFEPLVNTELAQFNWPLVKDLTEGRIKGMAAAFNSLVETFSRLEEGESMVVEFNK